MREAIAIIRPDSERAAVWRRVLGGDTAPIVGTIPHWGSAPGHPRALFFEMDLERLTPDQRRRLVAHLAETFGGSVEAVEAELDEVGVPILADDVRVSAGGRVVVE